VSMQSVERPTSRTLRIGYVLWLSGLMSTFIYLLQSWFAEWQSFNILVALGFAGVAALGFLLMRSGARQAKVSFAQMRIQMDILLFIGSLLATGGLALMAAELADVNTAPDANVWTSTFIIGVISFLLGIVITLFERSTAKDATRNIRG